MREGLFESPPEGAGASFRDPGPLLAGGLALVVAGGLAYAATRVPGGVWQVALAWLAVLVLAYAVFALGALVVFVLFVRVLDGLGRPRAERFWDHWPTMARILVPVLLSAWVVGGLLYGYDASQWIWTGASLLAGVVAIVAFTARRRRDAVPDGPDGPRHRGSAHGSATE